MCQVSPRRGLWAEGCNARPARCRPLPGRARCQLPRGLDVLGGFGELSHGFVAPASRSLTKRRWRRVRWRVGNSAHRLPPFVQLRLLPRSVSDPVWPPRKPLAWPRFNLQSLVGRISLHFHEHSISSVFREPFIMPCPAFPPPRPPSYIYSTPGRTFSILLALLPVVLCLCPLTTPIGGGTVY